MKRDELLTKLAMELAEWPVTADEAKRVMPEGWYWRGDDGAIHVGGGVESFSITATDWLQRRAELINKPSWSDAPEWAQWLAQDEDGEWFWHQNKPFVKLRAWTMPAPKDEGQSRASEGAIPKGHNWRETLEERPDECEPTVEEDEAFNAMAATLEKLHVPDARRLDAQLAEDMGKDSVGATLDERGKRYGDFSEGAAIMQSLKDEAHGAPGWQRLNYAQREAVDMILHKIGRVLNGDPDYADNWHDIAGYAQLVERTLTAKEREK